ncbi:cytosolic sulfotransferase 5-like [Impatiens glandulifera]|uniref:cytosolic sulfotransferase 5-like n=1 Tax=Impatiens glandulifera TaxID=253017 RepID=UPI001FB1526E|nr:cytosolic sulfotransferase 5-like [Impatiens glandulifera]
MAEIEEKKVKGGEFNTSSTDLDNVPSEKDWLINGVGLNQYNGFWCSPRFFTRMLSFHHHYKAESSDIWLVKLPKCGTTWFKALVFSIVNRHRFSLSESPLLKANPHALVRCYETDLNLHDPISYLEGLTHPRIMSTHVPYSGLPPSVRSSSCKIVSIFRDPRDQFVSYWHFMDKFWPNSTLRPFEECFDLFCRGVHEYGPFWDHILGSFNASAENPDKILLMRYEEMKMSPVLQTKKLASFLGYPFSEEEEKEGVLDGIVKLCSFDNLKDLEVNKEGRRPLGVPHKAFFRKGEVGDWTNYLTPSMADRIQNLMNEKFSNSGLTFDQLNRNGDEAS